MKNVQYKELLQPNQKRYKYLSHQTKEDFNRHFSKDDTQMAKWAEKMLHAYLVPCIQENHSISQELWQSASVSFTHEGQQPVGLRTLQGQQITKVVQGFREKKVGSTLIREANNTTVYGYSPEQG